MCASRCDQLNEGVNKLTRRKSFLWQNFIFGKVSSTTRVIYFCFMKAYQLFPDFKNSLHVPICVLLILGTQLFSRSNSSKMQPWQVRLKFRNQLELLPQIRSQIIFRVESGIISLDSNITDNITRTIIIVGHSDQFQKRGQVKGYLYQ